MPVRGHNLYLDCLIYPRYGGLCRALKTAASSNDSVRPRCMKLSSIRISSAATVSRYSERYHLSPPYDCRQNKNNNDNHHHDNNNNTNKLENLEAKFDHPVQTPFSTTTTIIIITSSLSTSNSTFEQEITIVVDEASI